ncbi:MAG: DsbC family protein [Wenzhouxiangellaceae bacterium]|nr:DsbC family protein [Wenzhouxiangellaceae bacterium]
MKRIAFGAVTLGLSFSAWAGDYEEVRERLKTLVNSEAADIAIAETPIPGMLEVRIGSDILYVSEDARYLLQGRLVDLETRQDLTDQAMGEVRKELIAGLDDEQMIQYGQDDSDFDIIVFTDVDCGYCRRLHQQVDEYNDAGITVHYAAFPRAGLGSETFRKMNSVWCADDQQAAMDIAKSGGSPAPAECDSPVADQYQLGQSIGVTGTPALVTRDGDLIPGYVPPQDLRVRLQQIAKSRAE